MGFAYFEVNTISDDGGVGRAVVGSHDVTRMNHTHAIDRIVQRTGTDRYRQGNRRDHVGRADHIRCRASHQLSVGRTACPAWACA